MRLKGITANGLKNIVRGSSTFFHTTSVEGLKGIHESGILKPGEGGFVSISEVPIAHGDISGNAYIIELTPEYIDDFIKVEYTFDWFMDNTDLAAYIAGEGWQEQFEYSDATMIKDEDGELWPDEDLEEQEFMEAMFEAFIAKESEREWVSVVENQNIPIKILDVERVEDYNG